MTMIRRIPAFALAIALTACATPAPTQQQQTPTNVAGAPAAIPSGRTNIPPLTVIAVAKYNGQPLAGAPVSVYRLGDSTALGTAKTEKDGSFSIAVQNVKVGTPLEITAYQDGHVLSTVSFADAASDDPTKANVRIYKIPELSITSTIAVGVMSNSLYGLGQAVVSHDPAAAIAPLDSAKAAFNSFVTGHGASVIAQGSNHIVAQGAGNIVAQGAGNIVAQGAGNIVAQGAGNIISTNGRNRRVFDAAASDGAQPALTPVPSLVATMHDLMLKLRTDAGVSATSVAYRRLQADDPNTQKYAYAPLTDQYNFTNGAPLQQDGQNTKPSDLPVYDASFVAGIYLDDGTVSDDKKIVADSVRYYLVDSLNAEKSVQKSTTDISALPTDDNPNSVDTTTIPEGGLVFQPTDDNSNPTQPVNPPDNNVPVFTQPELDGGAVGVSRPLPSPSVQAVGPIAVQNGNLTTTGGPTMLAPPLSNMTFSLSDIEYTGSEETPTGFAYTMLVSVKGGFQPTFAVTVTPFGDQGNITLDSVTPSGDGKVVVKYHGGLHDIAVLHVVATSGTDSLSIDYNPNQN